MTFAVQAMPDSPIRGTELFRRMMLAFGDEALAIEGVWRKSALPSINIDKVNELTASGMSLTDAVHQTWTVSRAKKAGFTRVTVLACSGIPGAYAKVNVRIER